MNSQLSMMICCIVKDELEISKNLLIALEKRISFHMPEAIISLRREEKYWKYENSREIIYGISAKKIIFVKDIINLFDISWEYSNIEAYNGDTETIEEQEEAIWNKNVYPQEAFLLPVVEWIHIYTWIE
jgi:hypothetical protein